MNFKWNSELLEVSTLKYLKQSSCSHISMWSLTAVEFFLDQQLHEEVNYLKDVLNNFFVTTLVDKCIKIFLNKKIAQKIVENTVPKKKLLIVLPYLDMSSFV